MNANRTLYARNAFAAAALALLGSVAATPAFAQDATRTQARADVLAAQGDGSLGSVAAQYGLDTQARPLLGTSNISRADVRAVAERAVASGEIEAQLGDSYGARVPLAASSLSRAEVRAATVQALRDGRIEAQVGESYGSRALPQRAGRVL
ncbi:hypothetical protein GT347_10340 [Xylophilus rhododendri]|uniref:DUF4148 domain-containing protein n=1 Tax=Xylophilus rhododendri TaxID=2697032 RepID=A0A857J3X1_9BURK|nr:hypothetical protein [Xylophilus rhododendri]QHI98357.1 hypothetical protein GT347_10340 [Xylophilus rhododendri]